ncbi:MAG: hypothetical protein BWY76_02663 [bacterium ADurb.Bin429]|nr:MAG: hypothetical protein BWY76_02663 [bacterium ADurb.Bin429]
MRNPRSVVIGIGIPRAKMRSPKSVRAPRAGSVSAMPKRSTPLTSSTRLPAKFTTPRSCSHSTVRRSSVCFKPLPSTTGVVRAARASLRASRMTYFRPSATRYRSIPPSPMASTWPSNSRMRLAAFAKSSSVPRRSMITSRPRKVTVTTLSREEEPRLTETTRSGLVSVMAIYLCPQSFAFIAHSPSSALSSPGPRKNS